MQSVDKFGYFTVANFKTYSRLEAIEISQRLNIPYTWNFNDEVYSQFDWTIEPDFSLWDLYTARAKQLREKYDYLVLFFSGGADSTNMLQAFLRSNTKIDEIVSLSNLEGSHDKMSRYNKETYLAALPMLENLKVLFPSLRDVKHTFIDICRPIIEVFKNKTIASDYIYLQNHMITPSGSSRGKIREVYPFWRTLAETGKKVCFLNGCEKPRFKVINNILHFTFWATADGCVPVINQMFPNPLDHDEFFYQSPDFPLIPIKQAHVVRNFLNNPEGTNYLYGDTPYNMVNLTVIVGGQKRLVDPKVIDQIIYPAWDPLTFSNGKRFSVTQSISDTWFYNLNSDESNQFLKAFDALSIEYPLELCRPDFTGATKERHFRFGILPAISKPYQIGKIPDQS